MKPKQLLILVAVLLVLGLIAFIASRSGDDTAPETADFRGTKLLEGWDINDVHGVQIKTHENEVNITKTDRGWVVKDRDDFPANKDNLITMLRKVWETPIIQAMEAGASQNERFELFPPDTEEVEATDKATKVTLKSKDDSEIGHFFIGKSQFNSSNDPSAGPFGGGGKTSRYLRTSKNEDLVIEVADNFSEELKNSGWPSSYGTIDAKPGEWLNKDDFIKVNKIKSIAIDFKEEGVEDYTLTRESDTGDFTISGAIPDGKELDASKVSRHKTLMGGPSFEDLLTEEQAKELDLSNAVEAKVTTFEGFTYTFTVGDKQGEASRLPMKFEVAGDFPTEREVEEGKEETPEQKKQADEAFQEDRKELVSKLEEEKKLAGHWFELNSSRIDALREPKTDLLKDIEVEDPPPSLADPNATEEGSASTSSVTPGKVDETPSTTTVTPSTTTVTPSTTTVTPPKPPTPRQLPPGITRTEDGRFEAVTPPVAIPPLEPKDDPEAEPANEEAATEEAKPDTPEEDESADSEDDGDS